MTFPRVVDRAVERPLGQIAAGTDAQPSAAVDVLLGEVGPGRRVARCPTKTR